MSPENATSSHKNAMKLQMEKQRLSDILGKIDQGEMIPGTVNGKSCKFKGIQKYSGRGKFSHLKGTDVIVLESYERKRSIILFLDPLLLFANSCIRVVFGTGGNSGGFTEADGIK